MFMRYSCIIRAAALRIYFKENLKQGNQLRESLRTIYKCYIFLRLPQGCHKKNNC